MLPIRNNGYSAAVAGNIQQDAQANLPIEPNNGNPMGANNMPAPQAAPSIFQYSTANPSPYMQALAAILKTGTANQPEAAAQVAAAAAPAPVLPQRVASMPVLPQRAV